MILRSGRLRKSFKRRTIAPRQGIGAQFLARRERRFAASRAASSTMRPVFPILVPATRPAVIELKFHDVDIDDTVIATGAIIQAAVNLIAQGVGESQRVGRKVTVRQIGWKWQIKLAGATSKANTSDVVRVMMVLDKQANLALPAVLDILETSSFLSFNNLSNKKRFRTLMDRTYTLKADAGGGDGTTEDYGEDVIYDSFHKRVNIPIEFNAAAGAITEITSNNIVILLASENGTSAFLSKVRLRFSDL